MTREELLDLLRAEFTREWSQLQRQAPARLYYNLIQREFFIDSILESVNNYIGKSNNREETRRYQEFVLTILSHEFARALYRTSERGTTVNTESIKQAQRILKTQGRCQIHPCSAV